MPLPESAAIPYEALDLCGERLLVLAPHPDDEVIACGGLVARHVRDRRAVRVIVVTDGREAGDPTAREEESRRALESIGVTDVAFLRYADRKLESELRGFGVAGLRGDEPRNPGTSRPRHLLEDLRTALFDFKPDLIALPSAVEIHPDHLALSRAFCDLIASDGSLFADLAIARVAFYEVSHPLRPNTLVDITPVADAKYAAIAMHESQAAFRDYVAYARGLNTYRSMTLPPEVKFAEAYWVTPLPSLRTMPFSALRNAMGAPPPIEVAGEAKPVSVIVRTKDRPALLREAIDSIRATRYSAEIVVVNDGGAKPEIDGVKLIEHEQSRGRSEAANSGARAATSPFIAFLDDDDLVYPEHFATLAAGTAPCYADAVSAFVRGGETQSRMRIFSRDFDRDLLLIDNYIPLPTILIPRDDFLDLGGFDPDFDLFEDWDFLIRLSQRHAFAHIARITCEIRHIEGSGSIIVENPAGSRRFHDAKMQVWRKHAPLLTHDLFATVFEREKQRTLRLEGDVVELKGLRGHLDENTTRLEREKAMLIADIQALQERINEAATRISNLDGRNDELRTALGLAQNERNELLIQVAQLGEVRKTLDETRGAFDESQRTISVLYAEIARLQGILDTIYQSRTWKLHEIVQRVKGRE